MEVERWILIWLDIIVGHEDVWDHGTKCDRTCVTLPGLQVSPAGSSFVHIYLYVCAYVRFLFMWPVWLWWDVNGFSINVMAVEDTVFSATLDYILFLSGINNLP